MKTENQQTGCDEDEWNTVILMCRVVWLAGKMLPGLLEHLMSATAPKFTSSLLNDVPRWIKAAAKMLNAGDEGEDWAAMAKVLGNQELKMNANICLFRLSVME